MAIGNVTIENARLLGGGFRNFSGAATKFTPAGERTFTIVVPEELVEPMMADGWPIKMLPPRDEHDSALPILKIKVHYSPTSRPPRIVMVASNKKTPLGQDEVGVLDWVDISYVDLIIRGYEWEVNGNSGVKPYLQSIYVVLNESELDIKYAELEEVYRPSSTGEVIEVESSGKILEIEAAPWDM